MLTISGLSSGYGGSVILRGIHLNVEPGQIVCLMGRNGVGKTTLMKTVMGLLRCREGSIAFDGADLTHAPPERRARAGIGYVPQGRGIFPQLTAEENLLLGLEANRDKSGKGRIPEAVFDAFPALRPLLSRKGGDLSGGQQQQLAIARAMASRPKLLLLDEPMEGIQPSVVLEIERFIESIKRSKEISVLLIEQSIEFACSVADTYAVIDKGQVVEQGTADMLNQERIKRHITV
jgi:urea transport system ATP-binding protein